jgi:hypothetical protein
MEKRITILLVLVVALVSRLGANEVSNVEPYSWSFRNFRSDHCAPPAEYYTWDRYRQTFIGVPPHPSINAGFDWGFFELVYEKELGSQGNCYGLALMSLQMARKGGHLGFCSPISQYSGDNIGVLPLMNAECTATPGTRRRTGPTNTELRRAIEETHGHQVNLASVRYSLELIATNKVDGEAAYQQAIAHAPALVSIVKDVSDPFGSAHTMLAYEAREVVGEKRIYVYDPNRSLGATNATPVDETRDQREYYEKGDNYITVNSDGSWQFVMGGASGTWPDGDGLIWITPVSVVGPRDRNPASMGLSVTSLLESVFLSGASGGSTTLKQVYAPGGRLNFELGSKKLDLSPLTCLVELLPFFPSDGASSRGDGKELYFFVEPPDGPREFQIQTDGNYYDLHINTRHWSVKVRGNGGEGGDDYVQVDGFKNVDPQIMLFNTAGVGSYDVELFRVFEPGKSGRKFLLKNLVMDERAVVDVRLAPRAEGLLVASPTGDVTFNLELENVENDKVGEAKVEEISIGAGSVGQIGAENWDDLRQDGILGGGRSLAPEELDDYQEIVLGGVTSEGPLGPDFDGTRDLGGAQDGSTVFEDQSDLYTQSSAGSGLGPAGDSAQLAYRRVHGDFELSVEIVDHQDPVGLSTVGAVRGLMARLDASPGSIFSQLQLVAEPRDTDAVRWAYRHDHGIDDSFSDRLGFDYPRGQLPRFLRMVRRGETFYGYVSTDGSTWRAVGSNTWYGLEEGAAVLVGFASASGEALVANQTTFRVLEFGAIDPPLPAPVPNDGLSSGEVVYEATFETGDDGAIPRRFSVQRGDGEFTPRIRDGRLQVLDAGFGNASTAAFSEFVLEDIDEASYRFDFDLFIGEPLTTEPGEGVSFVVLNGAETSLVGNSGDARGYEGLGRHPETGKHVLPNVFAVQIGHWPGSSRAEEGPGGAGDPLAISVHGPNQVASIAQAALGLDNPYLESGIHITVVYNRSGVSVSAVPNDADNPGDPADLSGSPTVETHVLPLTFSSNTSEAVFGFVGGSGERTMTAEVDNLRVTRIGCNDAQEVALIGHVPEQALGLEESVTLDGSFSHGGDGDAHESVSHNWWIVSGPAEIVGPGNGSTVTLEATGSGVVVVGLTVDDGVCANPDSTEVSLEFGGSEARGGCCVDGVCMDTLSQANCEASNGRYQGDGSVCGQSACALPFRRGDHDGSGVVDLTDSLNRLSFLFLGTMPSNCQDASDFDNSGTVDLTDSINELIYLFLGKVAPPPPGTEQCGLDPDEVIPAADGLPRQEAISLGCEEYPSPTGEPCP